jgi:general secretion pathway protein D
MFAGRDARLACARTGCRAGRAAVRGGFGRETGSDIEMMDLIDKVAKRTGKQFIVDPRVRAQVSHAGLDIERWTTPGSSPSLNDAHVRRVRSQRRRRVVPDANARQLPIPVTTEIPPERLDDEYVTVLITAKNMCRAQSVPVLRPLMPQAAHMAAYPLSNIADHLRSRGNARRIIDMVERLDKAAPAGQKCPASSSFKSD